MKQTYKNAIKTLGKPAYMIYKRIELWYAKKHPMKLADKIFFKQFGKHIDWNNPRDLNEKIQWLKFHEDQYKWAKLADKYDVREYVKTRGLDDILIPVFGKWDTAAALLEDWDDLPDEFVLKCNTGAGLILIVSEENGGKKKYEKRYITNLANKWLRVKHYNLTNAELHYQLINNCIFAEKVIKAADSSGVSSSLIDYKIWCFNGKPYGCFVAFNRSIKKKEYSYSFYDLNWVNHPELMKGTPSNVQLEKPKNWERMIEIASILSAGHPQVRVDLYNIDGKIYFGEMTMTAQGGFLRHYSQQLLEDMGNHIELDYQLKLNEFAR